VKTNSVSVGEDKSLRNANGKRKKMQKVSLIVLVFYLFQYLHSLFLCVLTLEKENQQH